MKITISRIIIKSLLCSGKFGKKIDINIPKLDDFIHKTYINVARRIYKNN
jgi:hypothetical protein